ncbi:MAG: AAA family ATPase [Pseudobacteriovorax sp.]|nr:AAA family ATPase [Pseudobacteriovorax sp.]
MEVSKYDFDCRKALHFGLRYAKGLGHDLLECEHVALALLRQKWDILEAEVHGFTERSLETFLQSYPKRFGAIQVEFGPRLNRALDTAERNSLKSQVSIDELWYVLSINSSAIKQALEKSKIDIRKREGFETADFWKQNNDTKQETTSPKADIPTTQPANNLDKALREFTTDLTQEAASDALDPVFGRDEEIRRVLEILGRKKKNNPILLGEPGVGKTAIAEGIALKIANGKVPQSLKNVRLLSLDLSSLVAGSKYRGEFEERLRKLVDSLISLKGQVILFVDELHTLIGAGQSEGGLDAANILKPALARGLLKCLGATTNTEFKRYIEKDPALERRFQPVVVDEPTGAATISILRGLKSKYEIFHAVEIEDTALVHAVDLSIKYLPTRRLPDKAIDVLDEACSRLKLNIESMPRELDIALSEISDLEVQKAALSASGVSDKKSLVRIEVKLNKLRTECEAIESAWNHHKSLLKDLSLAVKEQDDMEVLFEEAKRSGDFGLAATMETSERASINLKVVELKKRIHDIEARNPHLRQVVGKPEIEAIITEWCGVSPGNVNIDNRKLLSKVESNLSRRVFGQSSAISAVSKAVKRSQVGVDDPTKPSGVFLFSGPTGVGKTETAKALAEELFGSEEKMVRIDMSEFMAEYSVSRLIGAPPGYVGHDAGGELTDAVRQRPYSVVLFDEIEKAHPRIMDIMLQIFEDGRLTDSHGQLADFRHCLIILTTNIPMPNLVSQDLRSRDLQRQALNEYFRPELVNRIGDIVVFKSLNKDDLQRLIDKQLDLLNRRVSAYGIRLSLSSDLRSFLVDFSLSSPFGGRGLVRCFRDLVQDSVAARLITDEGWSGAWVMDIDSDESVIFEVDKGAHKFLPPAT